MQFVVIAYDGKDEHAFERRLAAREAHIRRAEELFNAGKLLFASAILNDEGKMIGSILICDFDSIDSLHNEWLSSEPYVVGNVWEKIEIKRAQVAKFCLKPL